MHTYFGSEGTVIRHNGDYSGDVMIELQTTPRVSNDTTVARVPFCDLEGLVLTALVKREIQVMDEAMGDLDALRLIFRRLMGRS